MKTQYLCAAENVDHDAIKELAGELRRQAIDAFWSEVFLRVKAIFARLRVSQGAPRQQSRI